MTYRRFPRFLALLVCLVVAPLLLASADHDKDKEKEKKDKDSAAAQQSHDHSNSGLQHGSTAKPTPAPAPAPQPVTESSSHHDRHSSTDHPSSDHTPSTGETHSGDVNRNRDHYTKTHVDTTRHTTEHVDHAHVTFDRDHFHARMSEHPDSAARRRAYERYHAERSYFVRHNTAIVFVPAHRVVLRSVRIVPTTYYYRRTVFYDEYGWTPPRYVYSFYPRYGLWDAVFLAFALDHIDDDEYALMFYHHRHEAEMEQWLADNRRLADENEDLRDRLGAMQARMDELQESGVRSDPTYVPPDAQDVALSPEVIEKLTSSSH